MMTNTDLPPDRRAEGLAAASRVRRDELVTLAEDIVRERWVEVVEAPTAATLMVQINGTVGEFCLGEVVVTYAAARVEGRDGWACVSGWDDEAAMAAAVCDAVADERVENLVRLSLENEGADRAAQAQSVAGTKLSLA